ncbi:MAG: hypothetical protein AAFV95_01490 [Bacteroidota bacterium]
MKTVFFAVQVIDAQLIGLTYRMVVVVAEDVMYILDRQRKQQDKDQACGCEKAICLAVFQNLL